MLARTSPAAALPAVNLAPSFTEAAALLRERMKPDAQPEREDLYNLLTEAGLSGDWRTRGLNLLRTVALGEGNPGRLADWLQGRKRDEVAALLERAASVAAGEATPGEQLRAAA